MRFRLFWLGAMAVLMTWISTTPAQTDPLPSWSGEPAKQTIIVFAPAVTRDGLSS